VLNGEKWFASSSNYASFFITMAVTDAAVSAYKGMSMFIVPAGTPGLETVREPHLAGRGHDGAAHGYLRFNDVRVPADHMLGGAGEAFVVAQVRLGGGRIHHAMRTIGMARRALNMMCERAVSRRTHRGTLGDKQLVQAMIADSWIQLEQFRLLVLHTAWKIDRCNDYKLVRKDISAVKAAMPRVLNEIVSRAIQIHGSLGVTDELSLVDDLVNSFVMGLADGPTEVHQVTLARELLKEVKPSQALFPDYHRPAARAWALAKYGAAFEGEAGR
jgi:acyl-CoA dehydrogenase